MKHLLLAVAVLPLAACVEPSAQMQRGVGFGNYELYQQQQAYMARARATATVPQPVSEVPVQTAAVAPVGTPPAVVAAPLPAPGQGGDIGVQTLAALGAPAQAPAQPPAAPIPAAPVEIAAAPMSALNPQALSSGGTEALAVPAAVAGPATVQAPVASSGGNVVAFALNTTHPVGQKVYRRANPFGAAMASRACARYPSPGLAQEAFLSRGGPERDALGLDPDGDGYACGWDPSPFRNIRG